jgi:hypothetical protein
MCKKREPRTDEQKAERLKKRSAFLTRMVDEFKKVVLIALFPLFAGTIIWCLVLYAQGVTPTVSPTVPIAAMGFLSGAYFVYCSSASKDKDSLNKNGLIKTAGGAIKKIVSTVSTVVNGETTDTEDSDEKPEE